MRKRSLTILVLLLLVAGALAAQESSGEKGALKHAKILPIQAKTLRIIGITRGIDSTLKDLGAKVTAQEIKIELAADVLFDFDKADLRRDAVPSLEKVATVLREYPAAPVLIEGHTDSVGADAYNQALSERRAAAVKDWLVRNARIEAARLSTRGWGENKPLAPNAKPNGEDDPEGRQKNRRVGITIRKSC